MFRIRLYSALNSLTPPLISRPIRWLSRGLTDLISLLRIRGNERLHLACGTNHMPGWANIDYYSTLKIIGLDLARKLPVRSGSIRLIYCEHFIEHIHHAEAGKLLRECHRVLKPGGILRISTPDLGKLISEYLTNNTDYWSDMNWRPSSPAHLLNEGLTFWGHKFVYDNAALLTQAEGAGFAIVRACSWQQSSEADLQNLESRPNHGELIIECVRE